MAIQHAMTILQWRENLAGDEMPPEWCWPFDSELERHFAEVERNRKQKYGIEDDDEMPVGETISNDLAKGIRG